MHTCLHACRKVRSISLLQAGHAAWLTTRALKVCLSPLPVCMHACAPCRLEKAAWQKQQKALESQVDKQRRAAEEARGRLSEQENALKQLALERRASQQER